MPITKRVMSQGDFSVQLVEGTPQDVLDAIRTPFSSIVVTAARLSSVASGIVDATALAAARYVGVVLRPGPQLELGGCGLEWWLGDPQDGTQPLETVVTGAAASLTAWVTALLPSPFTVGSISGAGTLSGQFQWVSVRAALDAVCTGFGVEWRINNTLTFDTGTAATLYGSTPAAMIVRRQSGREVASPQGLTGEVNASWNWEGYASKVVVLGQAARGSSGGASAYYDPAGVAMTRTRMVDGDESQAGSEATVAAKLLADMNSTVREVTVSTESYDVLGDVVPGGQLYVYDRQLGIYDTAVQVQHQGRVVNPASVRVYGVSMPIEQGMGVYYRTVTAGPTVTYTDLTPYVAWESPGGSIEIGSPTMGIGA